MNLHFLREEKEEEVVEEEGNADRDKKYSRCRVGMKRVGMEWNGKVEGGR